MPVIDRDKLEEHVRAFDARIRRRNAIEIATAAIVAVVFCARAFGFLPGLGGNALPVYIVRVGNFLVAVAAVYVAFQVHRRLPPIATELRRAGLLAFQIDQLERQSAALKSSAWWYAAPFLPGLVLIFGGYAALPSESLAWPLAGAAIALVVLALVVWLNTRTARSFDAEIRWLEEMERQSLG